MKWALLIFVFLVACGCAGPLKNLKQREELVSANGKFVFIYSPEDVSALRSISIAATRAAERLARWGTLSVPVHIYVLPTHDDLERATKRRGYEWLRAWAKYEEVYLQSPSTWGMFGASQSDLNELLLHELTHSLMYQISASRETWQSKGIPLWFREGMASFTANQAYRWPSLEALARHYNGAGAHEDPLTNAELMYRQRTHIVYGAAHHAFTFLVRRYGDETVRQILQLMSSGSSFNDAFVEAVGLSPIAFTDDFRRFVRLRGFQGGRRGSPQGAPDENP